MAKHLIPGDKTILAVKPGDTRGRLSDGDGLYLLLFVKGGAIIPMGQVASFSDEEPLEVVVLDVYPSGNSPPASLSVPPFNSPCR